MIEDTSFVIDVLKNDPGAVSRLEELEQNRIPEKLSSVTVLELFEGIYHLQNQRDELSRVLEIARTKHIIPADGRIMEEAGKLSGTLLREGEEIDREDCIIAASALREDEPVLTRNRKHFERVPGLSVETY